MKCALGLIVLAACGSAKPAPPRSTPVAAPLIGLVAPGSVPGLRWITPRMPWRTPNEVDAILQVPNATNEVLLVSDATWLGIMDLTTGLVTNERRVPNARQVVQLLDGRLVVFSVEDGRVRGAFVDPETLAITSEVELGDGDGEYLDAIVTPTGELVAALPGRPLAVLDPTTLQVARELSPTTDVYGLSASADAVVYYARKTAPPPPASSSSSLGTTHGYADNTIHQVALRPGSSIPAGMVVFAARKNAAVFGSSSLAGDGVGHIGAHSTELERITRAGALDPTGGHYASLNNGVLTVLGMRDGGVEMTIDVHDPDAGGYSDLAAFIGDRMVIAFHDQIRVVDLAKRTTTAAPLGSVGSISSITVDNAGIVETLGHDHVTYAAGHPTTSTVLPHEAFAAFGARPGSFAYWEEDPLTSLKSPDYLRRGWVNWFVDGKQVLHEPIDTNVGPLEGWSGHDAVVVMGRPGGYVYENYAMYQYRDSKDPVVVTSWEGNVGWLDLYPEFRPLAIDPDARLAIVKYPEGARLVDLTTGAPRHGVLPRSTCTSYVEMEQGGRRIALFDDTSVTIVDRETQRATVTIDLHRVPGDHRSVGFLPGREELLLRSDDRIAFVSPTTKQVWMAQIEGIQTMSTSPDGRQLAIAYRDGRVSLVDTDAFRARLPVISVNVVPIPRAPDRRCVIVAKDPQSITFGVLGKAAERCDYLVSVAVRNQVRHRLQLRLGVHREQDISAVCTARTSGLVNAWVGPQSCHRMRSPSARA
ncbi:MAG TPA: hypothetical protein VGM90_34485 [Kofleriaceae bacterium]|jgi:hypothetical protein